MTYSYYKNLVLAKTTGADIHDITGKLAAVGRERKRCHKTDPELIQYAKDCIAYIGKKTGVWVDWDDLEMT